MPLPALTEPWRIADVEVPNRVTLAPLAGIGSWVVRLQAKRHGAGYAVSEMVSSFAIHHRNPKTLETLLQTRPEEAEGGPTAFQLFGQDPEVMRSAAAHVAEHVPGVDVIDLNMGCPVPKVVKTGAGAAMLKDPETAIAVARAAAEGSGLPVTVKLRSGGKTGETDGYALAIRLVEEAGVAAIGFHPRSAQVHHRGTPDYDLAARLAEELPVPLVLTGGLHTVREIHAAYAHVRPAAVMLARGILGDPWLFERALGHRGEHEDPTRAEVLAEVDWVLDRTVEHLGAERAGRYLRKSHPWYASRLGLARAELDALQRTDDVERARELLHGAVAAPTEAVAA